jgi:hypothetical protein
MIVKPPKIDTRTFSQLLETLQSMVPHYTPEWTATAGDAGTALLNIHAFITEMVLTQFNQVPRKSLIAFLDMLGIKLLPAQSSRVPITFKPVQGADRDILVPARTQASADKTAEHDEVPFETEKDLLAVVSTLKEVVSVDPGADSVFVHTPGVVAPDGSVRDQQDAFSLFSGTDQQEHSLFLGNKDILNMKGPGEIRLEVTVPPAPGNASLDLIWEYWGEDKDKKVDRWITLDLKDDGTAGLRQSGELVLFKGLDGEIREVKLKDIFSATGRVPIKDAAFAETKNRLIRCRLKSPLTGELMGRLSAVDTIFLKTAPARPVPVDGGFFNDVPLNFTMATTEAHITACGSPEIEILAFVPGTTVSVDTVDGFVVSDDVQVLRNEIVIKEATITNITTDSKELTLLISEYTCTIGDTIRKLSKVKAFGSQPKLYDTFYLASKEAFSKKGAKISLFFSLSILDTSNDPSLSLDPQLAWEYWDGKGWQALTILRDDTDRFLTAGKGMAVEFVCPEGIKETEIFGQQNYWVRTRLIGGDYGREQYTPTTNKIEVLRKFKIPVIRDLSVSYTFDQTKEFEVCLSYNNLAFEDRSAEAKSANLAFFAFTPLPDADKGLYLGFDKQLSSGPIRIFFDLQELQYQEEEKPEIEWRFSCDQGWSVLDYLDETESFVVQGHLELIGPDGFIAKRIFDSSLFWLRGGLVKGAYKTLPHIKGTFPNTTWFMQAETIKNEILGSSDGQPFQTFSFFKFPVLEGEEVRVKEVLTEEERQTLAQAVLELHDETGAVTETWVLWSEVPDLFDSDPKSRHYTIDRASGQIGFGDGINGMTPPVGDDNIKAFSYQNGGGAKGNVGAREIKSLKSAVSGIEKVINPIAADGGADTATIDEMMEIGPASLSNRGRGVTAEDFEWMAREACRKVVRARCLPNRNQNGVPELGWVTVIIIPDSTDPKPYPSLTLKRLVKDYLDSHSLSTITSQGNVNVDGPSYTEMSVSLDLFVSSMDAASEASREAKRRLDAFFHPLTGGPQGEGWEFGRGVALSDVYALLEGISKVDHIENLQFQGREGDDFISVLPDSLIANGTHAINVRLQQGG